MFDCIVSQKQLYKRLLINPNGLVVCRFGLARTPSLVAVSQTQDKLVVFNVYSGTRSNLSNETDDIIIISVKDIICSVLTVHLKGNVHPQSAEEPSDLLLIGCASSIIVYDTMAQTNLFRINTSTKVNSFSSSCNWSHFHENKSNFQSSNNEPIVCGGPQRIYAVRLHKTSARLQQELASGEITSEKGTSDTVTSVIQGSFHELNIIITGSTERKIRVYRMDFFDYNIQACELMIAESAQVNCLCGIQTELADEELAQDSYKTDQGLSAKVLLENEPVTRSGSLLPSIGQEDAKTESTNELNSAAQNNEHLSHFAFGLENGSIGAYRLYKTTNTRDVALTNVRPKVSLGAERLWRHKSKHVPTKITMFDLNGDGYDELVIGYENGRIEVRSPFSGQLLAATRCFKSDKLIGLTNGAWTEAGNNLKVDVFGLSLNTEQKNFSAKANEISLVRTLFACSSNGQLIGFRARKVEKRKALRCFVGQSTSGQNSRTDQEFKSEIYDDWAGSSDLRSDDSLDLDEPMKLSTLNTIEEQTEEQGVFSLSNNEETSPLVRLDDDQDQDDLKPVGCNTKQNVDLMLQISRLQNEQRLLEQQAREAYHQAMQQVTATAQVLSNHSGAEHGVCLAYKWDFKLDEEVEKSFSLQLSLLVISYEAIDFIEVIDSDENLIEDGRMLLNAVDSQTLSDSLRASLFTIASIRPKGDRRTRITLRVFCSSNESRAKSKLTDNHTIAHVYKRILEVPRYVSLVPQSELWQEQDSNGFNNLVHVQFKLEDYSTLGTQEQRVGQIYAEILDWLAQNLICFQAGHWISDDNYAKSSWPKCEQLTKDDQDAPILLAQLLNHDGIKFTIHDWSLANDRSNSDTINKKSEEIDFELRLSYFNQNSKSVKQKDAKQSIFVISCRKNVLRLISDDYRLLVDFIQSLVVDHLKLDPKSECVQSNDNNLKPILDDLEKLSENSRELEESERRVQTELYEASDLIQNLMQQFHIAQQINEFSIAKELLEEIAIIFDGAQHSARAYYLNNREKLNYTKHVSELRENLTFLMGGEF